ncbi:MAG: hypothetical protein D6737_19335 [Chloroflexi bacterium]|nr:MAG: hypothetical protein D6737_19335 [Chloroflexota bacterium]
MADRRQQLMQEALDEQLSAEMQAELEAELKADRAVAAEFDRLQQVDRLLATAPFERAPQRLALNIIAKLAEDLQHKHLPRTSGLALALALSLMTLAALPLLISLSWFILSIIGSAAALSTALQQLMQILIAMRGMLDVVVEQAQLMTETYPQLAFVLLAFVPMSMLWAWLLRTMQRNTEATSL